MDEMRTQAVGDTLDKRGAPFDGIFRGEKRVTMIPPRLLGGRESVQVDCCASPESGALAATVSARFGGGAIAAVMHYVDFSAEREGKAEVVATMEYVGATEMPWLGFFTGLKRVWEVNGAKAQERLDSPTEWRSLSARCAELGLFNGGDRYERLVDTVSAIGRMSNVNDVDKVLAIWRDSVPEEKRERWPVIDPPAEDQVTETAQLGTLWPIQRVNERPTESPDGIGENGSAGEQDVVAIADDN